jgi:hypothetical protein
LYGVPFRMNATATITNPQIRELIMIVLALLVIASPFSRVGHSFAVGELVGTISPACLQQNCGAPFFCHHSDLTVQYHILIYCHRGRKSIKSSTTKQKAFGISKPKAQIAEGINVELNLSVQRGIYFFCSSFCLLTLLDRHLGQARSTMGPLGSKGILNSCPHLKHLKVASSAIVSPI